MYDELVKRLHRYSENCVAYKLDADFADAVQQAANAIEELSKSRWIPVMERLPDENDVVLITDSLDVGTGYLVHGYGWISPFDDIETSHVSHWMPLPEPPKEEG